MKNINLNQLRMVIKEAMKGEENLSAEEPEPQTRTMGAEEIAGSSAGGEQKADVRTALQYISKIDNAGEYAQTVMAVLQHAGKVKGGPSVLAKLKPKISSLFKQIGQANESRLKEDHAQSSPGGNWSQPGVVPPEPEGGEELPPEQVQEIAIQVVELLSGVGHNDIVDILNFAAENLGVVEMPPGPDVAIAEARKALKEGLIRQNFKNTLKRVLK